MATELSMQPNLLLTHPRDRGKPLPGMATSAACSAVRVPVTGEVAITCNGD